MPDFLPRGDAALLSWSANFVDAVRPVAAAGLEAGAADTADALHRAFAEAYALANSPGTRTSVAVRLKDECRAALVRHVRGLAGRVRAQSTTTSEHCIAMNIRPTRTGKGRIIPRSTVRPHIAVIGQDGARVTLLVLDKATKRSRAPQKALGASLYVAVRRPRRALPGGRKGVAARPPRGGRSADDHVLRRPAAGHAGLDRRVLDQPDRSGRHALHAGDDAPGRRRDGPGGVAGGRHGLVGHAIARLPPADGTQQRAR